jgi:hypothetical protein
MPFQSLKIIGVVALAAVVFVGYQIYRFGRPVRKFDVTSGVAGPFAVGETKQSLLARLPAQSYSPWPKPVACPANWIETNAMSPDQKQCLLNADQWETGGVKKLCPSQTDFFATLFFIENKVVRIAIRCTHPE